MFHYKITFNGGSRRGARLFTLTYYSRAMKLQISPEGATFCFDQLDYATPEQIVTFHTYEGSMGGQGKKSKKARVGYSFREGYWKLYLLYAVLYNKGLEVNRIGISIDGQEETEFTAQNNPNFPFMTCMFPPKPLELPPCLQNNRYAMDAILDKTKSIADNDLQLCMLQAYMLSRARRYELDRFLNLWTSVNALYCWLALEYQKEKSLRITEQLAQSLLNEREDAARFTARELAWAVQHLLNDDKTLQKAVEDAAKANPKLQKSCERFKTDKKYQATVRTGLEPDCQIAYNDEPCIGALMAWICPGAFLPRASIDRVGELIHEINAALADVLGDVLDKGSEKGKHLLQELYDAAKKHPDNAVPATDPMQPLFALPAAVYAGCPEGKKANIPLYCLLLLTYPYILRCNLFHGSKVQTVTAEYDGPEMLDYKTVNTFLDNFLQQMIPDILSGKWRKTNWFDPIDRYLAHRTEEFAERKHQKPSKRDELSSELRLNLLRQQLESR